MLKTGISKKEKSMCSLFLKGGGGVGGSQKFRFGRQLWTILKANITLSRLVVAGVRTQGYSSNAHDVDLFSHL
jgi:hypothetical protein